MKWATRANIHINRAASAGLIRCHIDPNAAEFVFLDDPAESLPTPPDSTCAESNYPTTTVTAASKPFCAVSSSTTPCYGDSLRSSTKPTSTTNATTPPKHPDWTPRCADCR